MPLPRFPHPRGDGPPTCRRCLRDWKISPPAWGWPGGELPPNASELDFPTRVGMARTSTPPGRRAHRFPHPRGDGPKRRSKSPSTSSISPPAWGWPGITAPAQNQDEDFPTRVGMARALGFCPGGNGGFPHPRGDGPLARQWWGARRWISPPAWGWPAGVVPESGRCRDFPTRVGMARERLDESNPLPGFPHPRGDGPPSQGHSRHRKAISPPAWGWPAAAAAARQSLGDFPTRVGMARVAV